MTEFSVPYGKTQLSFRIPQNFKTDELLPEEVQPLEDVDSALKQAFTHPLGRRKLESFADVHSIGIAINDKTRPLPQPNPLYALIDHLHTLGFDRDNITLFVSSGTHAPMPPADLHLILREDIIENYQVIVHDCDQSPMTDLGTTNHNTPIKVNADFFNCDLKIVVGNIEPHHFMGFSGGVKTAAIGLAGRETINTNHAMLKHPQAKSGVFHINPMRQDVEEIGQKMDIHFALGTILNEEKQILNAFFGDPALVMKSAIPLIGEIFGVTVSHPYDLVIASPGGAPKDINLYQAQKGLTHAARITRDNGWVILLAACPEGSGSQSYENYVSKAESHRSILRDFEEGFFKIGPHKAFQIAREAVRLNVIVVSDIDPQTIKNWKLTPSTPDLLQPLIDWILARLSDEARIAVMPASTRTMTEVKHAS